MPGSYGARFVKGQFRVGSDAGRLLGFVGFDADVRPEWPDRSVEAHGCPPPEPRAAVNPRASDRAAAARVSEAGLTASTAQAPARCRFGAGDRLGARKSSRSGGWFSSASGEAFGCARSIQGAPGLFDPGRVRPASSYPAALVGSAKWGAKGAGPILSAAYCSHSPARHPAHLGRLQTSASLCRLVLCFLSSLVRSRSVDPYAAARRAPSGTTPVST
jgi:hypothetical protein